MANICHYQDSDDPRKRAAYYLVDLSWLFSEAWETLQEASQKIVDGEYTNEQIREICDVVDDLELHDSEYIKEQKENAIDNLKRCMDS